MDKNSRKPPEPITAKRRPGDPAGFFILEFGVSRLNGFGKCYAAQRTRIALW